MKMMMNMKKKTIKKILVFIKFLLSSNFSGIMDLLFFTLIIWVSGNSRDFFVITIATISARIISTIINFMINKYWAFQSKGSTKREAFLFGLLFLTKMLLSGLLVWLISNNIQINSTIIKFVVDCLLFFFGYSIQKDIIFKKKGTR